MKGTHMMDASCIGESELQAFTFLLLFLKYLKDVPHQLVFCEQIVYRGVRNHLQQMGVDIDSDSAEGMF